MIIVISGHSGSDSVDGGPTSIRMALPADRATVVQLGDSRVIEVLFYSGHDDRTQNYQAVSKRGIKWTLSQPNIVSIDPYGRV